MNFPTSCLALNDLVRGRQADDLMEHLAEMWETLFRVLDDIKVREEFRIYVALMFISCHITRNCK